jgi:hypothetical protein
MLIARLPDQRRIKNLLSILMNLLASRQEKNLDGRSLFPWDRQGFRQTRGSILGTLPMQPILHPPEFFSMTGVMKREPASSRKKLDAFSSSKPYYFHIQPTAV